MKNNQPEISSQKTEANLPSAGQYEIDIRGYLDALIDGKFRILLICLLTIAVAVIYLVVAPPIYSSHVLLQFMSRENSSGVLGDISNALVTRNSTATAEVEIIKSRRILGATIVQLNLDSIIKPAQAVENGQIIVDSLEVGPEYVGKKLVLKSTGSGKYQLFGPDGSLLLTGLVGKLQVTQSPSLVEILLTRLDVEPGSEIYLTKKSLETSLTKLLKKLSIKEEGKSSGVYKMSLEGKNPRQIAGTLNSIVANYLAYSTARKSEEIQYMIDFVQRETLATRQRLEQAEAAQVDYLFSNNSTGLSSEVNLLVGRLASVEAKISELEIQKVGLESKYTQSHPVILDLDRKIELLSSEKAEVEYRLKMLPEKERERETLLRDVEAAKQLYIELQSKEQELGVALSGVASGIQVIDMAQVSATPIKPKRWTVLSMAVLAGLFLGVFYVIGRRALSSGHEART